MLDALRLQRQPPLTSEEGGAKWGRWGKDSSPSAELVISYIREANWGVGLGPAVGGPCSSIVRGPLHQQQVSLLVAHSEAHESSNSATHLSAWSDHQALLPEKGGGGGKVVVSPSSSTTT